MPTPRHATALASLASLALLGASGCELLGSASGAVAGLACPELRGGDALSAQFSVDARANGKVRAFVQAAKDLAGVSVQAEAEITERRELKVLVDAAKRSARKSFTSHLLSYVLVNLLTDLAYARLDPRIRFAA